MTFGYAKFLIKFLNGYSYQYLVIFKHEYSIGNLYTLFQNVFLPQRFKRRIKTEEERRADMIAAEKREEEIQAARMRELFGEVKQETTEFMIDMDPEPVKQVRAFL